MTGTRRRLRPSVHLATGGRTMTPEEEQSNLENQKPTSEPDEQGDAPSPGEREDRQASFTRRAILQAGWTVPVVVAVGVPRAVFAGSELAHVDTPHGDSLGTFDNHID